MKRLARAMAAALPLVAVFGSVFANTARATNAYGGNEVVVAMIDTGVRATHQEFDYQGPTSTTDQFVGWWDFSADAANHLPAPGQTWDTTTADPFDPNGHGTGTASLSVGRNTAPASSKQPSFAPGYKLAVAKVADTAGSINGDIGAAIRWAVDDVHADIISMSIGEIAPLPGLLNADVYDAMRYAREAGALMLVANGNGFANAEGPGEPGWATAYGNSTNVLSVGAVGTDGALVTTDPEVTSTFFNVGIASNSCDTCYVKESGTSFATPLVAGFAAHLMNTAVVNGRDASPARIEQLVKYSARDTTLPPNFEGYGVIDAAQLAAADAHATAGTLPARPSPDVSGMYVETVSGGLRDVWTNKLASGLKTLTLTGIPAESAPGAIGPSAPTGLGEAEVYSLTATPGQQVNVTVSFSPPDDLAVNDFDVYVFNTTGPTFSGLNQVAHSANAAGVNESVSFRSPAGGAYSVVVLGWSVVTEQPITVSANVATTLTAQEYALHDFGGGF